MNGREKIRKEMTDGSFENIKVKRVVPGSEKGPKILGEIVT